MAELYVVMVGSWALLYNSVSWAKFRRTPLSIRGSMLGFMCVVTVESWALLYKSISWVKLRI
jgi:hypothetical protein